MTLLRQRKEVAMKKILSIIIFISVFFSCLLPASASPLTNHLSEDIPHYRSINDFLHCLENPSLQEDAPILTYASSGRQIASENPSLTFIPFALSTAVILQNKNIWKTDSVDSFMSLLDAPAPIYLVGFFENDGVIIQEALSRQESIKTSNRNDMYHFLRMLYKRPGLFSEGLKNHNRRTPAAFLTTDLIALDLMTPHQEIIYPEDNHTAIEIGYLVPKTDEDKWKKLSSLMNFVNLLYR